MYGRATTPRRATCWSARSRSENVSSASDHPDVAATLGNLGNALLLQGDNAKARDVLERARRDQERTHGRDHPQVAKTLNNLGNTHGNLGNSKKCAAMLERTLAIEERAYGRDHPDVAITLGNVLGENAKAQDVLERARDRRPRAKKRHATGACTRDRLERALAIARRPPGARALAVIPS